jgi:hypothetical protein
VRRSYPTEHTDKLAAYPILRILSFGLDARGYGTSDTSKGGRKMAKSTTFETWKYRDASLATSLTQRQLIGYDVEAIDGEIGKIDGATLETDSGHIVVDTGPWIFGKKVMLPAGVLKSVDHADEKVFVNRTKDEIKNAPEFDDSFTNDEKYRTELGTYYGPGGRGFRDWD